MKSCLLNLKVGDVVLTAISNNNYKYRIISINGIGKYKAINLVTGYYLKPTVESFMNCTPIKIIKAKPMIKLEQ